MRKAVVVVVLGLAAALPLLRYKSEPSVAQPAAAAAPSSSSPSPQSTTSAPAVPGGQSTVDGPVVDSDFGPYQVRVTFSGTRITDVTIISEPGDRHSQRIANAAAPTLREEALQAQSANIDTVSGATATSDAYAQSLQGALDAKGH